MTDNKREKPLFIDMDFDEALKRFARTDKKEADELAEREKRKKKAGKDKSPPGSSVNRKGESGLRRCAYLAATPMSTNVFNAAKADAVIV